MIPEASVILKSTLASFFSSPKRIYRVSILLERIV